MNPQFETIDAANSYFAFKDNISNVASFLQINTVINFTALSRFYNNILNNSKSSFGKHFWKEFAIENLKYKQENLLRQLNECQEKLEETTKEKEEFDNAPSFKSLIPILENLKENAHYKSTRSQSQRLCLEVKSLYQQENNERPNMNYKAPPENENNNDSDFEFSLSDIENEDF